MTLRIICISASNIKHAGNNSTSLKACNLIEAMINKYTFNKIDVEIVSLVEYEFMPCIGCGKCYSLNECPLDKDFNEVYSLICNADALFIVSAHYAPIPSKLSILLEKVEQLAFLKRFNDESYRSPLYGKPVGIIGHGGGTEEIHKDYEASVIDSIWNALSYPVEMDIVGVDEEQPRGITFPVRNVTKAEGSIFPVQEYDWDDIEKRMFTLVNNIIYKLENH